jgi:hypothetical protein
MNKKMMKIVKALIGENPNITCAEVAKIVKGIRG